MRPTVFVPTGSTVEQIGRQELAADYEVVALARRRDAVAPAEPRLRVRAGDVPDPASLRDGNGGYDTEPGLNKREPRVV